MHPSYQGDDWNKSPLPSAPPANYYGYADQAAPPPPATGIPISTPTIPAPPLASQFQTTSNTPAGYWSTGICDCFSDCSNCKC